MIFKALTWQGINELRNGTADKACPSLCPCIVNALKMGPWLASSYAIWWKSNSALRVRALLNHETFWEEYVMHPSVCPSAFICPSVCLSVHRFVRNYLDRTWMKLVTDLRRLYCLVLGLNICNNSSQWRAKNFSSHFGEGERERERERACVRILTG